MMQTFTKTLVALAILALAAWVATGSDIAIAAFWIIDGIALVLLVTILAGQADRA